MFFQSNTQNLWCIVIFSIILHLLISLFNVYVTHHLQWQESLKTRLQHTKMADASHLQFQPCAKCPCAVLQSPGTTTVGYNQMCKNVVNVGNHVCPKCGFDLVQTGGTAVPSPNSPYSNTRKESYQISKETIGDSAITSTPSGDKDSVEQRHLAKKQRRSSTRHHTLTNQSHPPIEPSDFTLISKQSSEMALQQPQQSDEKIEGAASAHQHPSYISSISTMTTLPLEQRSSEDNSSSALLIVTLPDLDDIDSKPSEVSRVSFAQGKR